jgi:hypothetical protein
MEKKNGKKLFSIFFIFNNFYDFFLIFQHIKSEKSNENVVNRNSGRMKPKHLESRLQQLRGFDRPRLELEQYATPPELAVAILDQVFQLSREKNEYLLSK